MSKSLVIISLHTFYEEKISSDKVLKSGQRRALGGRSFPAEKRVGEKAPRPEHVCRKTRRRKVYD